MRGNYFHPETPARQAFSFDCIRRLGKISFDDALGLQEEAIETYRSTGAGLPLIYLLEHFPVITCGRSTSMENLLLSVEEYEMRGIAVRNIDRGGDVTYHGPGQVVLYPIIPLREYGLRAGEYVRILEDAMLRVCGDFGVEAHRRDGYPGCWTIAGKIGAVGTAVKSGGITKHGLSFNVVTELEYFNLIVPCGIRDFPVVRLADLAEGKVEVGDVGDRIARYVVEGISDGL